MENQEGRPLKFKTVEELKKTIDEYFLYCDNRLKKIWLEKTQSEAMIADPAPYTVHGLASWLDTNRQTLINYEKRDEFFDTIKRAKEKIAADVETRLMDGKAQSGAIFNLKNNFGWRDESQRDITSGGKPIMGGSARVPNDNGVSEDK